MSLDFIPLLTVVTGYGFLKPPGAVLQLPGIAHLDVSQVLVWCWPFRVLSFCMNDDRGLGNTPILT